jgi:hypothetical protein
VDKAIPSKGKSFWIGLKLTRPAGTGKILSAHWIDGSEMSYGDVKALNAGQHPWGKYKGYAPEPNNFKGKEACVIFSQSKTKIEAIEPVIEFGF